MKYGVTLLPTSYDSFRKHVRLAESLGFDYIGVADSQSLFRELIVSLTVAAMETERVHIGPSVSNPLTRHPAVMASAIASLHELSGGRAFMGIGTGDSAILNLGLRPARLAALREYVGALRSFMSGESAEYLGREGHVRWSKEPAPIMMSAEGPRTLRIAGEIADRVMIHTGLTPEILEDTVAHVRAGEWNVGKPLGSTEIWAFAKCNIADDHARAIDEIKMALAASAHHAFRFTLEGKHVPEELHEAMMAVQGEYVPAEHEQVGDTRNAAISDEFGVTNYLADRFAVVGTPDECRAKASQIAASGVDVLQITAISHDPSDIIRRFGKEVIAHIS
ncbi:MAG: LLM class flavin-dependent oxidoreductase [Chloroflexota bacterium]|nr:LLM class flavin-dependent oxidoreductase [Chloroflexota bacterium]MDE2685184.1 LLM class flavin-dependent oxidoreductase [Chloroflexota bacterium]